MGKNVHNGKFAFLSRERCQCLIFYEYAFIEDETLVPGAAHRRRRADPIKRGGKGRPLGF